MISINSLKYTEKTLDLEWTDGKRTELSALWLRDHCQMPSSRDPVSGQRLINITDIDQKTVIESVELHDSTLDVQFSPQTHHSKFDINWLYQNCYFSETDCDQRSAANKSLWGGDNFPDGLPMVMHEDFCNNLKSKHQALRQVSDLGFVLIKSVPCRPGTILDVISEFGFVRETNYGPLFEVRTEVDAINLAFTNLGLGCHLDNPYRDPVPGLQLLHCLSSSTEGGESILQDGFMAANILLQESQQHYNTLCQQWIEYRFENSTTELKSRVPMIETNDLGGVTKVRYNNRSIAPLKMATKQLEQFYPAYRHFAEILERRELQIQFKMDPGDLILFDNTRILHARTAYSGSGTRHLQGAYSDLDGLYSTLAKSID